MNIRRKIILCFYLTILSVAFLVGSHIAYANSNIDVTLTVPNAPVSGISSTFNCNPREAIIGGSIHCRVHLVNDKGEATANESVKVISNRNQSEIIDTVNPISQNTNNNGEADFDITSETVGEGILRAARIQDGSYIGDPVAFKFLPKAMPTPTLFFSDIYSDKTKLIIGRDIATISVKVLDQNRNPIPSLTVTLLYDAQFGISDQEKNLTNDQGIASFIYTPKKKGTAEIGAMTEAITLEKKVFIEISDGTLLNQIQSSEIAREIATIISPIIVTTTAFSLISLIVSIIGSMPATLHALVYGISFIFDAFGFRRKRRNWSRVYDSTTGKGVDLVLVRLYNQQTEKLIGTMVTNQQGRFNFQPQQGIYVISVAKEGFSFPTKIFAKYGMNRINNKSTKILNHYFGQPIKISGRDDFLNIDIPIDPIAKKFSFSLKTKIWAEEAFALLFSGLLYIFMPALIIGTLLSVFVAVVLSGRRNIIVAIVYLIVTVIYILNKMIKAGRFGTVVNEEGKPVSGVVISIFDKEHNTLKESQITDQFGRFVILAEAGDYILKAQKDGYDFNPKNLLALIEKSRTKDKFNGQVISMRKPKYIKLTIIGRKT